MNILRTSVRGIDPPDRDYKFLPKQGSVPINFIDKLFSFLNINFEFFHSLIFFFTACNFYITT